MIAECLSINTSTISIGIVTIESNAVNKPNGMVPLRIKGTVIVKEEISPLVKKKTFPNS